VCEREREREREREKHQHYGSLLKKKIIGGTFNPTLPRRKNMHHKSIIHNLLLRNKVLSTSGFEAFISF
jgi:hypothetical protein